MESLLKMADWLKVNPWLSVLSFLFALLSVILAVIFFIKSRRSKEPRYAIRSTNLIRDFTSRLEALEMTYAGKRISNLTVTKLLFWNNGKDTINGRDIASADPLMVKVKDEYKILDSSLLYTKNDANQFSIRHSDDGSHVLIQFDYLDQGEGGVIQLLHTGKSSGDIEVCGSIKGAGKPDRRKVLMDLPFPLQPLLIPAPSKERQRFLTTLIFALFIAPVLAGAIFFLVLRPVKLFGKPIPRNVQEIATTLSIATIIVIYWGLGFYVLKRRIPKGFEVFEKDI